MSTTIDEKVVSMQFDNSRFEKNVSTTMSTLDKLKQSLKFTGATKGLEEIDNVSKRVDMSAISNGIETVKAKFSALQIIGITALQNITNSAINYGKKIVSSLTIEPIKTGLQEYETQLNSVQTILANTESKGSTLEDVNKALDELNLYADKTIYNFTQMTRNIGTFTAAGVDLGTSVSAIKGIANLAAVSGSTSQQASTAMYQLSQALASGTVKLMDWNSVVNAGMGGQVFQDALKETARVHGIAIDDIIKKQGSFRESLSEGWLTSEILTETLSKFTGDLSEEQLKSMGYTENQIESIMKLGKTANDAATKVKTFTQLLDTLKEAAQSGWAQTWEIIIGDFAEAKDLWTKVSDTIGGVINESSEARNKLLGETFTSGWKQFLDQGVMDESGYVHYIKEVAKEHGFAVEQILDDEGKLDQKKFRQALKEGTITSEMMSESLVKLSDKYGKLSDEQLSNLGYTKDQATKLKELSEAIQNGSLSMDDFVNSIVKLSGRELVMESFANIWKSIVNVVKPVKEAFSEIFPPVTSDQLYNLLDGFRKLTESFRNFTETHGPNIKRIFKGIFSVFDVVITIVKKLASVIFKLIGYFANLSGGILEVGASFADFLTNIRNSIKESNVFSKITDFISRNVDKLAESIKGFSDSMKEKASTGLFDGILNVLNAIWNAFKTVFGEIGSIISTTFGNGDINESFGTMVDIINTGLLGTLILKFKDLFSTFESGQGLLDVIKEFFSTITNKVGEALDSITGPLKALQDQLKAEALKSLAIALGILAASLLVLSLIEPGRLEGALVMVVLALGSLMGALALMSKINVDGAKGVMKLIGIASALLVLSLALALLGTLDWGQILRGLVGIGVALAELIGALTLLSLSNKVGDSKGVAKLIAMSGALIILGTALKILGSMSWGQIGRSLTAMAGALTILIGALTLLSLTNKVGDAKGVGKLAVMAGMLVVLSLSLKILATMTWDDIARSLTVMAGTFVILTGILALLALVSKIGSIGGIVQLIAITGVLVTLSGVLKILATMNWDDIARSLTAMGGTLLILTGILALLALVSKISGSGSMIASAGALLVMAAAIMVLTPALVKLGKMDWGGIIKGFVAIAGAIAILGIASVVLASVIPSMLALAGAMTLVGLGMTLMGVGITLMTTALGALAASFAVSGTAILSMLTNVAKVIMETIPLLLVGIATGIIEFCRVIKDGAPVIGAALVAVVSASIDSLVQIIPKIASGLLQIVLGIMDALVDHLPSILEKLVNLLIKLFKGLSQFIPKLVIAAIEVFAEFFQGVVDALKSMDTKTLVNAILGVGLLAALMLALSAIVALVPSAMLGVLGMAAVITELAIVLAALGALARIPGLQELIADGGGLLRSVGNALGQFIGGIVGGIAEGATNSLPSLGSNLSRFMQNLAPFIDGIRTIDKSMVENAKNLAELMLVITAESLFNSIVNWITDGQAMNTFSRSLRTFGQGIKNFAEEVEGINPETVRAAAEAGKNLGQMAKSIPTSGGLWDLIAGKNDLKGFSNQLGYFGEGVKDFAEAVKGVDSGTVVSASEAGKALGEMASNIPTTGGLWNAGKSKGGVSAFCTNIKDFGNAIKSFVVKMNEVGDITVTTNKIDTLNKSLNDFATAGIDSMTESLNQAKAKVGNTVSDMLQGAISAVTSKISQFTNAGKSIMTKFANGIKSNKKLVKDEFGNVISATISAAEDENMYDDFHSLGKNAVQGFADGISENSYIAKAKSKAMAQAALEAARKVLNINSPSRAFRSLGESGGEGFVLGLQNYETDSYGEGENLGQIAIKGVKAAIAKLGSLVENGIDSQPTIRPVLDLSNISAGASAINGMFGMTPSVGVLARVGSINSSMNKIQNGGNSEVISAINDLKNTMENAPGDTYNINGITYDSGSEVASAIETLVRAAKIERRR